MLPVEAKVPAPGANISAGASALPLASHPSAISTLPSLSMWRYVPCETSEQGAETQLQSFKGGPRQLTFGFVQSVRHSSAHAHVVRFWPAIGESGLAMSGAKPLYVSGAFILEEGLSMEDLRIVVESKRAAAAESERINGGFATVGHGFHADTLTNGANSSALGFSFFRCSHPSLFDAHLLRVVTRVEVIEPIFAIRDACCQFHARYCLRFDARFPALCHG